MANMKIIQQAIETYLDSNFSHYAIHIDGGWGQGKTHFINDTLIPHLSCNKSKYKCIYLSLFGMSTRGDIEDAIIGIFASLSNSTLNTLICDVTKSLSFSSSDSDVKVSGGAIGAILNGVFNKIRENRLEETHQENIVFFFDDLERFLGDISIPMAYISRMIEVVGAKCVVLCNQQAFDGNDAEVSKRADFEMFKEKVIGRTIHFDISPSEVIDIIKTISGRKENSVLYKIVSDVFNNFNRLEDFQSQYYEPKNVIPDHFFPIEQQYRKNLRNFQKALYLIEFFSGDYKHQLMSNPLRVGALIILTIEQLNYNITEYRQNNSKAVNFIPPNWIDSFGITINDQNMVAEWLKCGYLQEATIKGSIGKWPIAKIIEITSIRDQYNLLAKKDDDLIDNGIKELMEEMRRDNVLYLVDVLTFIGFIFKSYSDKEAYKLRINTILRALIQHLQKLIDKDCNIVMLDYNWRTFSFWIENFAESSNASAYSLDEFIEFPTDEHSKIYTETAAPLLQTLDKLLQKFNYSENNK